jgi:hypothetical protein
MRASAELEQAHRQDQEVGVEWNKLTDKTKKWENLASQQDKVICL